MDPEKFDVVRVNQTGERYARRWLGTSVVEAYGPLRDGEATESALPHFDYSTEKAEWFMGKYIVNGNVMFTIVPPDEG
jgi:hypothetical protein